MILPGDIIYNILIFLDMKSAVSKGLVCREFHEVISMRSFWRQKYREYMREIDINDQKEHNNWLHLYKKEVKRRRRVREELFNKKNRYPILVTKECILYLYRLTYEERIKILDSTRMEGGWDKILTASYVWKYILKYDDKYIPKRDMNIIKSAIALGNTISSDNINSFSMGIQEYYYSSSRTLNLVVDMEKCDSILYDKGFIDAYGMSSEEMGIGFLTEHNLWIDALKNSPNKVMENTFLNAKMMVEGILYMQQNRYTCYC